MKFENLNIEELVELRTSMILEGKDVTSLSFLIDCKESEYLSSLFEDGPGGAAAAASIGMGGGGVAYSNAATGGMGGAVAAQPSNNTGVTTEPGYTAGGGKTGTDISIPYNAGGTKMFQKAPVDNRRGTNKRRKNKVLAGLKSVFANRQDFTAGQGKDKPKRVMNFDSFSKDELNKVTHNKQ